MKYDISVIVPIYNEEIHISKCIDSILKNYVCNYEILLIDDGSTDNSNKICKKYQEQDRHCKLISKSNGGSVSARMEGIKASLGEYIAFVDADDRIDDNYLDYAINIIKQHSEIDIFIGNMVKVALDSDELVDGDGYQCLMTRSEAVEEMFSWNHYRWEMAGKIYRRTLFDDYIPQKGIKIAEDLDSNWILFNKANYFFFSNACNYYYCDNPMSITRTINPLDNDSWKVYSKILCDERYKSPSVISVLTKRAWESLWNTYRIAYLTKEAEGRNICNTIERIAKKIYGYSDCGASTLPSIWNEHKSFMNMTNFNIELNWRSITDVNSIGRVFIYGCGNIATYVTLLCEEKKLDIQGYIVSNKSVNNNIFRGKKVLSISEYKAMKNDLIIVSMSSDKQNEVKMIWDNKIIPTNVVYIECWQ